MKKILIAILPVLMLAACGSNGSKTEELSQHDLITKFTPIISGTWVLSDYVAALEKTRSPKEASAALKGPVMMQINPADMNGDTVYVGSSLNNHEGYTFYLYMRAGQDAYSLQTGHTDESGGFYELAYEAGADTTLLLKHYSDDATLLDSKAYTKVTGPQGDESQPYGVAYMANKVLFAGDYTLTEEATGEVQDITLTADGIIKGMGTHSTYFVFTDFESEEETNLDELLFDERTRNQKGYIFEIEGDTIRLYKALENEERTLLIKGEHSYTMVRR